MIDRLSGAGAGARAGAAPLPALDAARLETALLVLITLLGGALRLFHLGRESLWVDEGFSWRWAHLPLGSLWGAEGRLEYNPPLYYTLQHAWLLLGGGSGEDRAALLRLPAALLGTLAIPLTYRLGRTLAGPGLGLLAALLLALSGFHLVYSQDARGYTLLGDAFLLAATGLAAFLAATGRAESWRKAVPGLCAYALGAVAALYTHATAAFLPLLANLAVLPWLLVVAIRNPGPPEQRRRLGGLLLAWALANLAVLLAWLGWLPVLIAQARAPDPIHGFIEQPRPVAALIDLVRLYGLHELPSLRPFDLLLAAPLPLLALLGAWHLHRRHRPAAVLILVAFAVGLPLLVLLAGAVGRPLWLPRTVLASLPFGLTLVAAGLLALPPRLPTPRSRAPWGPRPRAALTAAVLALSTANLAGYYRIPSKEPWNRAAEAIAAGWRPGDAVLVIPAYAHAALRFYLRRAGYDGPVLGLEVEPPPRPTIDEVKVPGVDEGLIQVYLPGIGRAVAGKSRLWLITRRPEATDASGRLRARVAAFGTIVEHQRLDPYLELFLVSAAAAPAGR